MKSRNVRQTSFVRLRLFSSGPGEDVEIEPGEQLVQAFGRERPGRVFPGGRFRATSRSPDAATPACSGRSAEGIASFRGSTARHWAGIGAQGIGGGGVLLRLAERQRPFVQRAVEKANITTPSRARLEEFEPGSVPRK